MSEINRSLFDPTNDVISEVMLANARQIMCAGFPGHYGELLLDIICI